MAGRAQVRATGSLIATIVAARPDVARRTIWPPIAVKPTTMASNKTSIRFMAIEAGAIEAGAIEAGASRTGASRTGRLG